MTSGSNITPTPPTTTTSAKPSGQVVQIVSLPEALQNNARAVRLEGEVIAQNKDGSIRVRTSQGDIDIIVRGKQPQEGAKVEIDIPQGSPPRTATIRNAPTPAPIPQQQIPDSGQLPTTPPRVENTTIQTPQTSVSSKPQTTQSLTAQTNADTSIKPNLPATYQPPVKGATTTPPLPTPLTVGQVVRLTPIPPAQAQQIITQSLQTLTANQSVTSSQIVRVAFQGDIVAKDAPQKLQGALIQTLKSFALPTTPTSTAPLTTPTTPLPTPSQNGNIPIVGNTGLISTPTTNGQSNPTSSTSSLLGVDVKTNTLSPLSLLSNDGDGEINIIRQLILGNLGTASPKISGLDVKIIDIKPLGLQLTPTTISPTPTPQILGTAEPQTNPTVLKGIVTGFTPQNLPLVTIQFPTGAVTQNFALQFPTTDLDVGTQIFFTPQKNSTPLATNTLNTISQPPLTPLSSWPVFDEVFQTLLQNSPTLAQSLTRIIPSPTNAQNFGAAVLLLLANLRGGDLGGWMGDKKIDALSKAGKGNLIQRLANDTSPNIQQNLDSPANGEWKSYPLPLLWQNEISKVMFHVKHDREGSEKENKEGSTRFVMDLSLTRMGDVQLDGHIRGKRLDVIVRTQMPISMPMQEAMKRAYADALEGGDIFGELGFQGDMKGWMNVLKREDKLTLSS